MPVKAVDAHAWGPAAQLDDANVGVEATVIVGPTEDGVLTLDIRSPLGDKRLLMRRELLEAELQAAIDAPRRMAVDG